MTALFLKVLEMSVMGSVVVLVTILTRFLLRRRSKRFIMILWAVVAVRMLIPLNIGSAISIFNYIPLHDGAISSYIQEAETSQTEEAVNAGTNTELESFAVEKDPAASVAEDDTFRIETVITDEYSVHAERSPDMKSVLVFVWLAGAVAVAAYSVIRFTVLKIRLRDAVKTGRNVYVSDKVRSPFVFGLIVPKIYLPEVLGDKEREYILMHERTHIRRGDWLRKIVGMAVVAIHWFNPLAWLAFILFGQDIEMSCDEMTVKDMDAGLKQAYAVSIVNFAKRSNSRMYLVTQLGFSINDSGRKEVANRVRNIISYRKGTKITTALMTIVMLLLAASLGLNSKPVLAAEEIIPSVKNESTVKREAPFDYVSAEPVVNKISDTEKEISFYRDGKQISGRLKLPEGEGPFRTIVLCGTTYLQGLTYDKVTRYFTESGYAVVMFEPNLTVDDYSAPAPNSGLTYHYILDLYAVMDELRYLPDVDREYIYLWGHQSGGAAAAYAGTERQTEIKGVILVEPEFEEYTFSEEPKLTVKTSDNLQLCKVPVTVIWGKMLFGSRLAEKTVNNLQYGKLVMLEGNSYGRTFDDEYAGQAAEETVKAIRNWKHCDDCNVYYLKG